MAHGEPAGPVAPLPAGDPRGATEPRAAHGQDDTHFRWSTTSGSASRRPRNACQACRTAVPPTVWTCNGRCGRWADRPGRQPVHPTRSTTRWWTGCRAPTRWRCCSTNPRRPDRRARQWKPQRPRARWRSQSDAPIDTVRNPLGRLKHLAEDLGSPATRWSTRQPRSWAPADRGDARTPRINCSDPARPTGGGRGQRGDLAGVKADEDQIGGTVNDVILAAITNGYREFLLGRVSRCCPEHAPLYAPWSR